MAAITSGLGTAARRVAALERELRRVAMLDRAIESDDRAFKLAAGFTVALITTLAITDEAERARQAGAHRLCERLNELLRGERERVASKPN